MTEKEEQLSKDIQNLERGQEEYIINFCLYTADILSKHSYIVEETEAMIMPQYVQAHQALNSVAGRLLSDAAALRRVIRTCSSCHRYFIGTEPKYASDPWTGEKVKELCPECAEKFRQHAGAEDEGLPEF